MALCYSQTGQLRTQSEEAPYYDFKPDPLAAREAKRIAWNPPIDSKDLVVKVVFILIACAARREGAGGGGRGVAGREAEGFHLTPRRVEDRPEGLVLGDLRVRHRAAGRANLFGERQVEG